MELKQEWIDKYDESLTSHLLHYRTAARKLGVHPGLIAIHDDSKFSEDEYPHYVLKFGGGVDDPGFDHAWLHHIRNNPHHPEHWVIPGKENKILEMPEKYVREMVADWMGSNMAYQGTFDMTEWLKGNLGRILLHDRSFEVLVSILVSELGYKKSEILAWRLK